MEIKKEFDEASKKYDAQRRQLIPCFDDFYGVATSVIECANPAPRVLDIGGGTGLFSMYVLQRFPQAKITLIDLSEQMLAQAKERFAGYDWFEYLAEDYTEYEFEGKFDLIISALSIHHLTDKQKERLYRKCYDLLRPGGVLINADQVLSPSPAVEKMFYRLWMERVASSGIGQEEMERAYKRLALDKQSTMEAQLRWLEKAGFCDVDCVYKYYHFAVFYAKKTE